MMSQNENRENYTGLTSEQAREALVKYGKNELVPQKHESFFIKLLHIIAEPMFLLLIVASVIYFFLGEPRDGAIMLVFVVGMICIDAVQEWKTDKTVSALRELSAPSVTAVRDGESVTVPTAELVPGDLMIVCEGVKIPADGCIVRCNDLCVDESSLTGESEGVWKTVCGEETDASGNDNVYFRRDCCYAGTLVTQGSAYVLIEKTGASAEYGKIGRSVAEASSEKTPLQKQTSSLVKTCAGIAAVLFALVGVVTYFNIPDSLPGDRVIKSILSGITLAMAMIPEEFPVILTVFLSMGAWRLAKKNSLVRRLPSVETLGAVSVLCVDKTGTVTQNRMSVKEIWCAGGCAEDELRETMGLGCETETYDPMEQAMLSYCAEHGIERGHIFGGELVSEYAFTNELKMMGHVWEHDDELFVAAKGSPERIFTLCGLTGAQKSEASEKLDDMSGNGLRVIAVAKQNLLSRDEIPMSITDCRLTLCGLVGLYDPPRESVRRDIDVCTKAGIRVVMITGDNGVTASSIARLVGINADGGVISGDMLEKMTDDELCEKVKTVNIFSRVIPQHKMRIVKAFKKNGHIVAMTGDGVNDAPALKSADIGIAMGKRGSEVSREAADLILMDDNFSTIVDTVRDGRRIYGNIRKAVGYVFTIHIPIALASLLAPLIRIAPTELLLLPIHVVLLELLIDPTCSVVLERQPAELDVMDAPPRPAFEKILSSSMLIKSVLQGIVIFVASFGSYYALFRAGEGAEVARSAGLAVIILANILLVQVNSSEHDFVFVSARRLVHDKVMWIVSAGTLCLLAAVLYTPLAAFLKLAPLSGKQLLLAVVAAAVSVMWYELVKLVRKLSRKRRKS